MTVPDLLRPWTRLLGDGADARRAGLDVLARYAESHRRYHDGRHLAELLAALDGLSGGSAPPIVVLAAYWHDAVYDPRAGDSEQRSAELAAAVLPGLGVAPSSTAEVVRLVLLTAAHDPAPDDTDGALLSDADLSVLAAVPERYDAYAADVRAEYAHVPDDAFRTGRAAVLRALVDREQVYASEPARVRWEAAARRNVGTELSRLVGAAGAVPRP